MLKKWGARPKQGKVKKWRDTLVEAEAKGSSNAKVQTYTTAWKKFQDVLSDLNFPVSILQEKGSALSWDEEKFSMHETLLAIYIAEISPGHERADTSMAYARSVSKSWNKIHKVVLWPEVMFEAFGTTNKGLDKLKDHTKHEREGTSAADIAIMTLTLREWERKGKRVSNRQGDVWDTRLVSTVTAALCFCYGLLYRFGDATVPDGEDFDPRQRLSRASVWYSKKCKGVPDSMTLDPPCNKVSNAHTGRPLSGNFTEDCINWPAAVDRMIACDRVPHHLRHTTPLFRDTRKSKLCSASRDGTFEAGGKALSGHFMRRVIRSLVKENQEWFGTRTPDLFGIHSMRIGGLNDALKGGASLFDVASLGRWTSDSVFRYHRMTKTVAHEWQQRSIDVSFGEARNEMVRAGISEDVANARQARLDAAKACRPFSERTERIAVARPSRLSGRALAEQSSKQLTLDAWRVNPNKRAKLS